MWFKYLHIYRLPAPWAISAIELERYITTQKFMPCTSLEMNSEGWVPPRGNQLVYSVNRQMFLTLQTERKLLPASVIKRFVKERACEIEEQQGFTPGRKQLRNIKEQVTDELLPRAFSLHSHTQVWIDPVNGWLVVDTASSTKAEAVIKLLMASVEKFALQTLRTAYSPLTCMTEWLAEDAAPADFTIDQDTELRAAGAGKATVRYVHHTLEDDDMRRHIAAGKQCTWLAMTWSDQISFVLTEDLAIKRIEALDVLKKSDVFGQNGDERFNADALLMTGELNKMLTALVAALGGEHDQQADLVQQAATLPLDCSIESDALYKDAVAIVTQHGRGSVSLIQRHLRIGYNRAARLLEQMEMTGVVSAMHSNGNRDVLTARTNSTHAFL